MHAKQVGRCRRRPVHTSSSSPIHPEAYKSFVATCRYRPITPPHDLSKNPSLAFTGRGSKRNGLAAKNNGASEALHLLTLARVAAIISVMTEED